MRGLRGEETDALLALLVRARIGSCALEVRRFENWALLGALRPHLLNNQFQPFP